MKRLRGVLGCCGSALLLWACGGGETGEAPGGGLGTRTQPIVAEQSGGVAEAVWRWYDDPDIAKSSYASPVWYQPGGGTIICSASMIGPNFMLTAGHCGAPANVTLSFLTYGQDNNTAKRFEDFNCKMLYSTWHSSDLVLYHCPPNASGVSPGDKYGYLDFDTGTLSVGAPVYSIWGNPLDTPTPAQYDVRFLSKGVITSTTGWGTFTTDPANVQVNPSTGLPDYTTSNERPIGISTSLWSNYGASGSGQLSATSHKLVVGPLSTGVPDGAGRNALSIARYLLDGTVDGRDPATRNTANISALGLTPANYTGLIDKDADKLIDLQEDLERLRGENARTWYALDFDSERRNVLWTPGTDPGITVTFNTTDRTAHLVKAGTSPVTQPILRHQRLNLAAGTYRLSLQLDTASALYDDALWFGIRWVDPVTSATHVQGNWLWSPPGTGWSMHAMEVTLPTVNGAEVMIGTESWVTARVAAVNVVRKGAMMNLDTADLRFHWRNDVTGGRGRVVPRGVNSGSQTDWALRVKYDASAPTGWPIRNRQFALVGAHRYRLCFDHRQESSGMGGVMRVVSSGEERVRQTFSPGASWASACTPSFRAKTNDNNVQFGVTSGTGSYLVDNIDIQDQPRFTVEPGIDRPGSDIRFFNMPVADPVLCEDACANETGCLAYTYVAPGIQGVQARCYLKNAVPTSYAFSGCHSGYRLP
ncbi:PAN domain-containing protein [Corallococcus terminator]